MKKIYHLSTCQTCQKIIAELSEGEGFELQDIKTEKVTPEQIDFMKEKIGSYEELFSRKAIKFRSRGLNEQELNEQDYRNLILEEYTFLKRPIIVMDDEVFVGNAKKTIQSVKAKL